MGDEVVDDGGRGVEVLGQAAVAAPQGVAGALEVAASEGVDDLVDPCVLGHDMAGTAQQRVVVVVVVVVRAFGERGEIVERGLAQRADDAFGCLTLSAASRILGGRELAALTGVDHADRGILRHRDETGGEVVAIDPYGGPGRPAGDRQLIHDSARNPGGGLLASLGGECELAPVPLLAGRRFERRRHAHRQCGR